MTGSKTCLYIRGSSHPRFNYGRITARGHSETLSAAKMPRSCGSPCSSPASSTRCSRGPASRPSRCSSGSAARSRFRSIRRAVAKCTGIRGLRAEAARLADRLPGVFARVRRHRDPVGAPVPRPCARPPSWRRVFELSEFLVGELGVEDVGASFPHRVTYHPTCHSLRAAAGRRRAAAAAARRCATSSWSSSPTPQECCGFGGTFAVKNADVSRPCSPTSCAAIRDTRRRGVRGGGQLVPAAHRRRAARAGRTGVRALHLAEILASTDDARLPGGGRVALPTRSCAATCARPRRDPRQARAVVAEVDGLGGAARRGRGDQGAARCAGCDVLLEELEAAVQAAGGKGALGARRGRGQRGRRRPRAPRRRREVVKVKSLTTDEIGLNEALEQRGITRDGDRPCGADRAARPRLLLAHPRARHPPQPAPRSATCSRASSGSKSSATSRASSPRPPGGTCAQTFLGRGWRSRAPTSPSPRPARCAWWSPRATGACARRCRRSSSP